MTLSRWLRDYLYIPLGGNRKGRTRTYVNLMLTMVLGGLWHGAGWTFIFWGFLYGVALTVEHVRIDRRKDRARLVQRQRLELAAAFDGLADAAPAAAGAPASASAPPLEYDRQPWHGVWLPRIGVFAFVTFAWIFFRSDSFGAAARASSPGCSRAGAPSAPPSPRACFSPSPSASACSTCRAPCGSAVRPASRS